MSYRILVAEDEDASRSEMERILAKYTPHEIVTARDGVQALEIAKGLPIDLLITDVRMPRKSGIDLLRELVEFHPGLMSIVITGFAGEEAPVQALKLGAKDYIHKPISAQALIQSVERLMKIRALEDEARRLSETLQLFRSRIEEALSVAGVTSRLSTHASTDVLLGKLAHFARRLVRASCVGVWLVEADGLAPDKPSLHLGHESTGGHAGERVASGQGIAGRVAATGQILCGAGDLVAPPLPPFEAGHRTTLACPLKIGEKVVGVLELFDKEGGEPFGKSDLELLSQCAELAAIAIADNQKDARINSLLLDTLKAAVAPGDAGGVKNTVVEGIRPAMEGLGFGAPLEEGALEVARVIQKIHALGPDAIGYCRQVLVGFLEVMERHSGSGASL